jgi:hypothetical protein
MGRMIDKSTRWPPFAIVFVLLLVIETRKNKRRSITSASTSRSTRSNHVNRSLPAIALTVPAFNLRGRVSDPKSVA